jgi:hypothetical protein
MLRTIAPLLMLIVSVSRASTDPVPNTLAPLSKEWAPLAMITKLHSLAHRKSGLTVRVLESDGSASVAENPISLFVVATNGGTSDLREYVWRLPGGVARLKKLLPSECGVDIAAEIDVQDSERGVSKKRSVVMKACFIDSKGTLESQLKLDDGSVAPARTR